MFWIAAALMLALAVILRLTLPFQPAVAAMPYSALLRSLGGLVRDEPTLRLHSLLGAMSFGAFGAFWATLAVYLESLPEHYGPQTTGLFGVVGVVGAVAAPLAGRYADVRGDRRINAMACGIVLASFVVLAFLGSWLWGIALGVILLDLGAQANHISNQARVYSLRPEARSRLNTIYMVSYFVGGASGSWLGTAAWVRFGWPGVCVLGGSMALVALIALRVGASVVPQPAAPRS
jgi:predicted MFS family arabinose efflux permease